MLQQRLCILVAAVSILGGGVPSSAAASSPAAAQAAAPTPERRVEGVVFEDTNRNGVRDRGEPGVADVVVSDQRTVTRSAADGSYALAAASDAAIVFLSAPDGWSPVGSFWRPLADQAATAHVDFALSKRPRSGDFTFLHASDTHLSEKSLPRIRRLREIVEAEKPDFVLLTGDLVRDALRVGEAEARGYYEMVVAELARFPVPVFTVPGNHETFGIERHLSLVSRDHPLYGRKMYRHYLGPEYYSFNWGGVHFLGIDSVDFDDLWYYGHVDAAQLAWVAEDTAAVPAGMPVVTFNHIPLATAVDALSGYTEEPPAPTLIRIDGHMQYRHVVSNTADLLARLNGHRLEIALGGHMHASESLALDTTVGRVRFHQTAAVVGPAEGGGFEYVSGVTLYRVHDGHVDDGRFLPLDAANAPAAH